MDGTLELPALGRLMCLGTLYDCRSHQIISPGATLWDSETISTLHEVSEKKGNKLTLISSDTFDEKSKALEIDESLKASILAGSVSTKGSAKFLVDHHTPEGKCRLSVLSKASTTFEKLTLNQLSSCTIQHPEVITEGKATHVVTGIMYGSNTFFVFDKKGEEDGLKALVALVTKFTSDPVDDGSTYDFDPNEISDVQCTVHCDMNLEGCPSNFKDAVKLFTKLPELLKENAVPTKVFLYPLHKIDSRAARVCKIVSDDLLSQAQTFLEGLEHCLRRANKMADDPLFIDFPQFAEKFAFFKRMVKEYKVWFKKELARVLPSIQGGSDGESILKDMLQNAVSMSPFKLAELNAWLDSKRKELSAVRLYVRFLPEVEIVKSRETLDDILMDPSIENVVCLTFRLAGQEEEYLTALSQHLITGKENKYTTHHWYDDGAVMKFMRSKAKLFSDFFRSNPKSPCTKFIVTGFRDHNSPTASQEAKVGGTVLLYEQGTLSQKDFEPPSRPEKPKCKVIDHNSIDVAWSQPTNGASGVQKYIVKFKRFRGQKQADAICDEVFTESSETSATVKNLEPNEALEVRVVAVCAVGVGPESESSGMVKTLPASPPGTPVAHPLSATSIALEWDEPPQSGYQVTIQSYIIRFGVFANGALQNSQEIDIGSPERQHTIEKLVANTSYLFQVSAIYDSGVTSLPSVSSVCLTLPVSPPGKPEVSAFTASSIAVHWKAPNLIGQGVKLREYVLQYTEVGKQQSQWQSVTSDLRRQCMVQGLMPNTAYVFRVILVSDNGFQTESEASNPFTTLPAGPPDCITCEQTSATDIVLKWAKPVSVGKEIAINHYRIEYRSDTNSEVVETGTNICTFTIKKATPETVFKISVTAVCGEDNQVGERSGVVQFKTRRLLKHDVGAKAKLLQPGNTKDGRPCILKFPLKDVRLKPYSQSYRFGEPPKMQVEEHKVIMVVGVTGSGKSTLINGMANHILDVDRQDNFRFKIVDVHEGKGRSQAHSQTQTIASYTIYHNNFLSLPYTLTVIDTPGFGDTRGIGRDKAIIDQIREFFSDAESHGIDHIDAIGFVVQASQARLTQTQRYVFDSILSVFGKDISKNIVLLVTFADSSRPPVLNAVEAADIPYNGSMFKFNNSALFAGRGNTHKGGSKNTGKAGDHELDEMGVYWTMGKQNLQDFFASVHSLDPRSLVLTKEVLEERKRLEVAVQGLLPQIQLGICKLEELRSEHQLLQQHEAEIEANRDFKFDVEVPKCKKVDITGNYITNCSKCHFTCHYPCHIGDDSRKAECAAMQDGVCTVCPGKCAWDVHFNQQYKFEYYTEKEQRTFDEIQARYNEASGKKMTVEQVIKKQIEELEAIRRCVFALIADSRKCIVRLEEIALKPNPLSVVEYIDVLIEGEKHSSKPGWQARVSTLQDVRKEADIMSKLKKDNYDPFESYKNTFAPAGQDKKMSWFKRLFTLSW